MLFSYQVVQRRRQDNVFRTELASAVGRLTDPDRRTRSSRGRSKIPREILDKIPQYTYYPDHLTFPPKAAGQDKEEAASDIEMAIINPPDGAPPVPVPTDEEDDKENLEEEHKEKEEEQGGGGGGGGNNESNEPDSPLNLHLKRPEEAATTTVTTKTAPLTREEERVELQRQALLSAQTTCVICLDDFTPGLSVIRELPCNHVFHSRCIDTFLTRSSSLCPLCKRDVMSWFPEDDKNSEQRDTQSMEV